MKVFVTGSNGFLGGWVVKSLIDKGYEVKALVRKNSCLDNLSNLNIEYCYGDVLDEKSIMNGLSGCDSIIHVAGVANFKPSAAKAMMNVNINGVNNICETALKTNIKKIVVTSSIVALGGSEKPVIMKEDQPSIAESTGVNYYISKFKGEQSALSYQKLGLDLCVLRPVMLLGPGDINNSSTALFLDLATGKLPVYVNGGASFCDVREVANAHVSALEKGRSGEIYILGGHNVEMRDLVQIVSNITGAKRPYEVSYNFAYFVASLIEFFAKKIKIETSLSKELIKASKLFTYASSEKAIKELDYSIRSLDSSLIDTFSYFIQTKRLKPSSKELKKLLN